LSSRDAHTPEVSHWLTVSPSEVAAGRNRKETVRVPPGRCPPISERWCLALPVQTRLVPFRECEADTRSAAEQDSQLRVLHEHLAAFKAALNERASIEP